MASISFPLRSTFVALPLQNEALHEFARLQEQLLPFEEILRLQNPKTPHLTLQFWPSLMEIEYKQIISQCSKIASKASAFHLKIMEAETFGSRGEDHVLFLSVAFSDELARIKKSCPWPALPADKPFRPHITLARIAHPQRFAVVKKKIMKLLSESEFTASFDRLRLYGVVEEVHQTPLEDFVFAA